MHDVAALGGAVLIRPRVQEDLPKLVAIADAVRAVDRWPPHRVGRTFEFIAGTQPLAALVAVRDGALAGHVTLHERSAGGVIQVAADALGVDAARLAIVARLFVDPEQRGIGIGRALLDAAAAEARRLEKHAILDVWEELDRAIQLYERAAWRRVGKVAFSFTSPCGPDCLHDGQSLTSFVYAAPRSPAPSQVTD